MERRVNLRGYTLDTVDGDASNDVQPVIVMESVVSPNDVSGKLEFSFGLANRDGGDWFAVLAPDQSVLGAAEISSGVEDFMETMIEQESYTVIVEFVEELSDEGDDWYQMEWLDNAPAGSEEEPVYVEKASVEGAFQAQMRSLLNQIQDK